MLKLNFNQRSGSAYRILCLGSHCDDIEIGCGGTILRLIQNYLNTEFYWVVFSSSPQREQEAYKSASIFLSDVKTKRIEVKKFRDGFLPYAGAEVKEVFEQLKQDFSPDIIFTHYRNDLHQDHRLVCDLTWNTFRNHFILEYEIPKYDGDLGNPNFYVHLNESTCQNKARYILENFQSQRGKSWFTEETFLSILRLRGIESNAPNNYAEGFYCRKITF